MNTKLVYKPCPRYPRMNELVIDGNGVSIVFKNNKPYMYVMGIIDDDLEKYARECIDNNLNYDDRNNPAYVFIMEDLDAFNDLIKNRSFEILNMHYCKKSKSFWGAISLRG